MQSKSTLINDLYILASKGEDLSKLGLVTLKGWVKTNRDSGSIGFISLNDGTCFKPIQVIYSPTLSNFEVVSHILTGACIEIKGNLVMTPEMKQPFEIHAEEINILGDCSSDYPLQKKRHSFEYLRDLAYLRPRTNTFLALYRLRSKLALGIHQFFQDRGFVYVHTPEITANDAEGAGQVFTVCTSSDGKLDDKDFFGRRASLTVSGQLHVEAFASAFRNVYTFGPTFRAEKSNTPRHASEFWMIEPEIFFGDLDDDMELMEDTIKFCISYVLEHCKDEMEFFDKMIAPGLIEKLNHVLATPFTKME